MEQTIQDNKILSLKEKIILLEQNIQEKNISMEKYM